MKTEHKRQLIALLSKQIGKKKNNLLKFLDYLVKDEAEQSNLEEENRTEARPESELLTLLFPEKGLTALEK